MGVKLSSLLTAMIGVALFAFPLSAQSPLLSGSAKADAPRCLRRSELIALKDSRSLVAEAALAAGLLPDGHTTSTFTATLLQQAAEQLDEAKASLADRDDIISLLDSALSQIAGRDAEALRNSSVKLLGIEKANEQCS